MSQIDRTSRLAQAQQLEYERATRQKRMLLDKRVPNASQGVKDSWDGNIEREVLMDADRGYGTQRGAAANVLADKLRAEREATTGYRQNMTNAARSSDVAMAGQAGLDSALKQRLGQIEAMSGDIKNQYNKQEIGVRQDVVNQGLSEARGMQPINESRGRAEVEGIGMQNAGMNEQNIRAKEFNRIATPAQAAAAAAAANMEGRRANRDATMFANEQTAFANMPPTLNPEYVESQAKADKAKAEASYADTTAAAAKKAATSGIDGTTPEQAAKTLEQRKAMGELNNITPERRAQISQVLSGISSQMSNAQRGKIAGSSFTGSGDASLELADQLLNYLEDLENLAAGGGPQAAEAANLAREIIEGMPAPDDSGSYGLGVPIASTFTPFAIPSAVNAGTRKKAADKLTQARQRAEKLKTEARRRDLPTYGR